MSSPGPPPPAPTFEASKCAWIMARAIDSFIATFFPGRSLVLGGELSGHDNVSMSAPRGTRRALAGAVSDAGALRTVVAAREREDQWIAALELGERVAVERGAGRARRTRP